MGKNPTVVEEDDGSSDPDPESTPFQMGRLIMAEFGSTLEDSAFSQGRPRRGAARPTGLFLGRGWATGCVWAIWDYSGLFALPKAWKVA